MAEGTNYSKNTIEFWLENFAAYPTLAPYCLTRFAIRECERRLRGDDLIRQMVEMSKEEGLVDFSGWIKAAEKYLEGK